MQKQYGTRGSSLPITAHLGPERDHVASRSRQIRSPSMHELTPPLEQIPPPDRRPRWRHRLADDPWYYGLRNPHVVPLTGIIGTLVWLAGCLLLAFWLDQRWPWQFAIVVITLAVTTFALFFLALKLAGNAGFLAACLSAIGGTVSLLDCYRKQQKCRWMKKSETKGMPYSTTYAR
jgi:hypothetical protein